MQNVIWNGDFSDELELIGTRPVYNFNIRYMTVKEVRTETTLTHMPLSPVLRVQRYCEGSVNWLCYQSNRNVSIKKRPKMKNWGVFSSEHVNF